MEENIALSDKLIAGVNERLKTTLKNNMIEARFVKIWLQLVQQQVEN